MLRDFLLALNRLAVRSVMNDSPRNLAKFVNKRCFVVLRSLGLDIAQCVSVSCPLTAVRVAARRQAAFKNKSNVIATYRACDNEALLNMRCNIIPSKAGDGLYPIYAPT